MKFLVFQHITVEHPGIFREFMQQDGITWDTVELDQGDPIPDLHLYDALIVMGGPMDVWQEQEHPWLIREKQLIRKAIKELNLPYLGICLGHQLLADAIGGKVSMMSEPEVGLMPIELTEQGKQSRLFNNCEPDIDTLQWHGAAVETAPDNSKILASSPLCSVQALQVGELAFSMQFHIEVTNTTVQEWSEIPEYQQSLECVMGEDAVQKMNDSTQTALNSLNQTAQIIYNNFIEIVRTQNNFLCS